MKLLLYMRLLKNPSIPVVCHHIVNHQPPFVICDNRFTRSGHATSLKVNFGLWSIFSKQSSIISSAKILISRCGKKMPQIIWKKDQDKLCRQHIAGSNCSQAASTRVGKTKKKAREFIYLYGDYFSTPLSCRSTDRQLFDPSTGVLSHEYLLAFNALLICEMYGWRIAFTVLVDE
uniref:Uncharacterized protein n=1 Tax=Glossina pallidipes TaxID=7398 RepID=A0A1A9ZM05_GLOPL